ncbi:period circadian protein isoform X2 [Maniola jurtina]|uniref:period circadian protein isoform X2 n=1 Tax=Maniola jurtina TaxID=191418 RepID=UPI001E68ACD2|nr:period circadian protein isoform X2 [Maniola jurtina]
MDNLDESENNAKVSDSAYSNSCSNSQSRRSRSSKSTHSGSNSSGSSGYGGKPSTSGYSINNESQPPEKRSKDKDAKKKIPLQGLQTDLKVTEVINENECVPEIAPIFESSKEDISDVAQTQSPGLVQPEKGPETMEVSDRTSGKDEPVVCDTPVGTPVMFVTSDPNSTQTYDGFSCVISLQDGIVMYTTSSITTALGFPKDMWIGRSFIDFVHQRDRNTFASQITNGLAAPKSVNGTQTKAPDLGDHVSTMVCRIRRYKGLNTGFGIKDRVVTYMPFLLKFFFKNMNEDEGQVMYLVIQASPFFSAFKTPNEIVTNPKPFVMRHSPSGRLDYIDPESVPYLGYLPQDIIEKDVLLLYHPSDLFYLRQVYETIVKEGGEQRSKPYRMMAQNGDYLKLETEWTSFINPWSRKLEFVIGKHFIIEGPTNPDVFQTPEPDKFFKKYTEEETKAQAIRENMIRIMNEVLTKPAEAAKQQMSKRCQDLASFMESLIEEAPKPEEELRLVIQDADHSCYERDSVMLGGISPHHDYNDSHTSSETTLSYNQLNYNENLQRYFDSHEPYNVEKTDALAICDHANTSEMQEPVAGTRCILSNPGELDERASTSDSNAAAGASTSRAGTSIEYPALRLTESLLNKHNIDMEKELLKKHRETRSSSKGEREKASNESRQKKKEHLARCNALYQPTTAGLSADKAHGLKRASKQTEDGTTHKHRCSSPRNRRRFSQKVTNSPPLQATNNVPSPWPPNPVNNMNAFILGLGIPPQMSVMSPMTVPGALPMYYTPTSTQQMPSRFNPNTNLPHAHYHRYQNVSTVNPHMQYMQQGQINESDVVFQMNSVFATSGEANRVHPNNIPPTHYQQIHQSNQLQCMMLGQTVYGSPFMYSAIDPQMSYALQQSFVPQQTPNTQPLELSTSNYEEACKLTMPQKLGKSYFGNMRREKMAEVRANKGGHGRNIIGSSSVGASNRSTDTMTDERIKRRLDNSDSNNDKTDGESSYSSFYSSFFKTDSGSGSDTRHQNNKEDNKTPYRHKTNGKFWHNSDVSMTNVANARKIPRRKMDPPWMEQVCVTSELIYKYQIVTKNIDEVLSSDKEKLKQLEQPSLVNEQLSQLYLDLQLEGVAARLTLEEGITSSSSSGEESTAKSSKSRRRKREYSRLVMIYEEDAPLPPPDDTCSSYTS